MLSNLRQAKAAFSHLNPAGVRKLADRTLRIGLIAASDRRYEAMEDLLVPHAVPVEERAMSRSLIFRGGEGYAPALVDVVLYEEGIPAADDAYVLRRHDPVSMIDAVLHDHPEYELPLARQFPGLRTHVVDRIVRDIARENALFAMATALPDLVPNLVEVPWIFGEWASDTAFLTANQVRMAFLIAAACGKEIGLLEQKGQLLSIGAGAFGWRAIARELAGKIPFGGGLLAKGAIAYAGTVVVGKGLEYLHRENMNFPHELRRRTYRDALNRGRELAKGWLPEGVKRRSSRGAATEMVN